MDDTAYLLWIEFRGLIGRHVVNEEVIPNLGVSEDPFLVSLGNSLSEDSRILRVE